MKAFVIAIPQHEKSQGAADRCIASGKRHGVEIDKFNAITPSVDLEELAAQHQVPLKLFNEKYSRTSNCIAAFFSHFTLWKKCIELNQPIAIFEHDAVVSGQLPTTPFNYVMSIGQPSYGKHVVPTHLGVGPLTSKPYFPGAHAYMVNPAGAKRLIERAKLDAGPTDVFLDIRRFPWLQEFYPWTAYAADSFSTIQNKTGCLAKHNYKEGYEIVDVK